MRISAAETTLTVNTASRTPAGGGGRRFHELLVDSRRQAGAGGDFHTELQGLYQRIERGRMPGTQELLLYQIRAGEFHLKVELAAKAAETLLSAARRFQNPQ